MSRPTDAQLRVLARFVDNPGGRTTAHCFNEYCGNPKTVRALFAKGLVDADGIPAGYVSITDIGRAALIASHQDREGS